MNNNIKIGGLRGSIFVPRKIVYSKELVSSMEETLPDFRPFILPDPKTGKITFDDACDWVLCSNSNNYLLAFLHQKVDYIERGEHLFSEDSINCFTDKCIKVFDLILKHSGVKATRLAFAPTFKEVFDGKGFNDFISRKIYAINRFGDSMVEGSEVSQVFHRYEKINEQDVRMNYLSRFYKRNDNNTNNEVYMLDFDINTSPNNDNSFDTVSVNDFYSKSPAFCNSFLELYFENKKD